MKISKIITEKNQSNINFKSTRTLKNTVAQLSKNNDYSLTEINQRRITDAIQELGNTPGKKNINFLLNIAAKNNYNTNIKLRDLPKHDWKSMLITAALTAISITPFINQTQMAKKITKLNKNPKLTPIEVEILNNREKLLQAVDLKQIKKETTGGTKDFQRNLDYFIISSETTQEHKKYVLEQLNYLMSDKYEINPQLEDKKSIVVAEIINDIAIATPEHEIPNIKAVDQKQHGMCAAISIVRKKLAYEDKPNYINSILSELDSSDFIRVYDRSHLGSGKKVQIEKVPVDFKTALEKGYRIIDASTMHWMQIARMSGYSNISTNNYNPFDSENFDVNADSFFNAKFENPELRNYQTYYQALLKINDSLESYKLSKIRKDIKRSSRTQGMTKNIQTISSINNSLMDILNSINIGLSPKETKTFLGEILKLRKTYSSQISLLNKYEYIDNEEETVKQRKIKNFILEKYPNAKLDNSSLTKLYDTIMLYYDHVADIEAPHSSINSKVRKVQNLYEIAAGYRYQFVTGLDNEIVLKNIASTTNLPTQEVLLLETVDKYIDILNNSPSTESNYIIKSISENFPDTKADKDSVLQILNAVRADLIAITSAGYDNIYKKIGKSTRKETLINYFKNLEIEIAENNSSVAKNTASTIFNMKFNKNKILTAIQKSIAEISDGNETVYSKYLKKLGIVSDFEILDKNYRNFVESLQGEDFETIVKEFAENNNFVFDGSEESLEILKNKIDELDRHYNYIKTSIENYTSRLTIRDNDNFIISSPDLKINLIKKLEKSGEILSEKQLTELQTHLNKIQRDKSNDEFSSIEHKLRNENLYKFSKNEMDALNKVDDRINYMYRYIQNQISNVRSYIKAPLEELNRVVGIDNGEWWVSEGNSGLNNGQIIRILEYITGRPYHTESNIKDAIKHIKKSPYSAISTSSVFHDRAGFHAQYVVDIEPRTFVTQDSDGNQKVVTKDILFQDNTWGAREHENVWVDSQGMTRTDYSDNRGGTLGYITNKQYQNGNFVDRILEDMVLVDTPSTINNKVYKKITHANSKHVYKSPQYTDLVVDGISPESHDYAYRVYEEIFQPNTNLVKVITNITKNMSFEEVQNLIKQKKIYSNTWARIYEDLTKRINDTKHGIINLTDYEALPDDDYLKVTLEKIALKSNYPIEEFSSQLAKINSVADLKEFQDKQKKKALEAFKYAFNKNTEPLKYLANSIDNKDAESIINILNRYNIKLTDEQYYSLLGDFKIDNNKFNGSAKNTINTLMEDIDKNLRTITRNENAIIDIENRIRSIFFHKLYFNKHDISNKNIQHIINFIDNTFNPEDNNELTSIFRKIQDMTTEEFNKEILPLLKNEDINIKNRTGFDVLKSIKMHDSTATDDLRNNIFFDEYSKGKKDNPTNKKYTYNKFSREETLTTKYTFDIAYNNMKNALSTLNYQKLFNKYKGKNLELSGVYPAYPKTAFATEEILGRNFNIIISATQNIVNQIQSGYGILALYNIAESLEKYCKKLDDDTLIGTRRYNNINNLLGLLVTLLNSDATQIDTVDNANTVMQIERGANFGEYRPYLNQIIENIHSLMTKFPADSITNNIEENKKILSAQMNLFVDTSIQKRYKSKFTKLMQEYKQSLIKGNGKTEDLMSQLWEEYKKDNLLNNPEEILDLYILSTAKGSPFANIQSNISPLLTRGLQFAKLAEIQSTLMDILSDGIETDVKDAFKNIKITLEDGYSIPMSSNDIIVQIVENLILDSQEDTALLLLDKLGLNEQYVEGIAKSINYDGIEKTLDEVTTAQLNYNGFNEYYEKVLNEAYSELTDGKDAFKVANKLKRQLLAGSKQFNIDKKEIRTLSKAIDIIKQNLPDNNTSAAIDIFNVILQNAIAEYTNIIESKLDSLNTILEDVNSLVNLVNGITLDEDSKAYKIREDLTNKINKLYKDHEDVLNLPENQ